MVFTLAVDDVDAMCDTLRARGVEILNGPMDRPSGASAPPASATRAATSGRSPRATRARANHRTRVSLQYQRESHSSSEVPSHDHRNVRDRHERAGRRALIERGFNNGDLDGLDAFVAHDCVEHQEGSTSGIDGLRALITELRTAYSDLHLEIQDTATSGTRSGSGSVPPARTTARCGVVRRRAGRSTSPSSTSTCRRRPHGRTLGRSQSAGGAQADRRDGRRRPRTADEAGQDGLRL